ncbi:scavenger receptor cysteine-rich type 1 protein M130 [Spinachia spinachia]
MWLPLLLLVCCSHHQLLIAQAIDRTVLVNSSIPCQGYIGIVHDGQLGYVGGKNWNDHASKVVCSSIQCGTPIKSHLMTAPWHIQRFWINEVNCTGEEAQLWQCKFPGFGVSHHREDSLQSIECSHNISIRLDGFECAGAVQYSVDGGVNYSGYICADGWAKEEADVLCKTLNCGTTKEVVNQQWMGWKAFRQKTKMMAKCSGIETVTHLWQCAMKERSSCQRPASVICTGHETVQLQGDKSNVCSGQLQKEEGGKWTPVQNNTINPDKWCQQMHCGTSSVLNGTDLTCSDQVKVVLMDNNTLSKCYGKVYIQVNNTSQPVCGSSWNKKEAEVVCKELGCGKVHQSNNVLHTTMGIMDNVWCSGTETSLWHCRAKRDRTAFQCPSHAHVVCTGSFEVRLQEGPGKCSGRLEIQQEGKWKSVHGQGKTWPDKNSDTVCKLLNCRNKRNVLEISQDSAEFLSGTLQCTENNIIHISQCIKEAPKTRAEKMSVVITCEEHKVVFLKGNEPCSGMVGIEQGTQTYWLSGSSETWNAESANTVCQQMHCDKASNYSHIKNPVAAGRKSIWKESYSCSSNTKSLFDCQRNPNVSSDHGDTIATVTCSGTITASLTNRCWGNVNICLGKKCGEVCSHSWTELNAVMLCKNLGCGTRVLHATTKPKESQVIFEGVHSTIETTNLTQCNFVLADENDNTCRNPAYVVCSGSIKTRFSHLSDKCSGSIEMLYEGKWIPVCAKALKEKNVQETICGELKCGQASKLIDYFGPEAGGGPFITDIQCSADGHKSLAACSITSKRESCNPGFLQCSGWRRITLTVGNACSGAAIVHSEGKRSAISFEGWTERMGNMLCNHLECGRLKHNKSHFTLQSPANTYFDCATVNDPKSFWDCERKVPSNMKSQWKQQLLIECQDEPNITLSEGCYGEVKINNLEVCDTNWKPIYSDRVCSQQTCGGKAIMGSSNDRTPVRDKKYHHLRCDDNHYQLGQCKRFKEKCNGKLVSVYCVGNVKFNTTEKCGGQIEVQYRGKWEKVCSQNHTDSELWKKLCNEMNCGDYTMTQNKIRNNPVKSSLEITLQCTKENQNIRYCLSNRLCESSRPAEIYCNEYATIPIQSNVKYSAWPAVMAVSFAVFVVILIFVVLRIKRAKKGQNVSPGVFSGKEDALESGKSNEMEELNHTRIRSETQAFTGNDASSTSSFAYDDIDEVAVVQPLTSLADTAKASDGATYEVDDSEENYDDIEACSEIPQTEAEIHDVTRTAAESDAATPPGSELQDDNYLVPRRVSRS